MMASTRNVHEILHVNTFFFLSFISTNNNNGIFKNGNIFIIIVRSLWYYKLTAIFFYLSFLNPELNKNITAHSTPNTLT
jgi:hypothetical protein